MSDSVASYETPEAVDAIQILWFSMYDGTTYEVTCGACGRIHRFTTTAHPGSWIDDADWHWDGHRWLCHKDGPYTYSTPPEVK